MHSVLVVPVYVYRVEIELLTCMFMEWKLNLLA